MAIVTTCPHCATSFNVAPDVLLSRNGRVRCGKCKQIFDGLLSLTTFEAFQSAAAVSGGRAETTIAAPPIAPVQINWPALPDVPEVPVPPMPLEVVAAASPAYLPGESPESGAPSPDLNANEAGDVRDTDVAVSVPSRGARWWAFAAALAALVLAGQLLYRYRSELAANLPSARPVLARVCAWAGCRIPPLQQPAVLNIEASDLQVVDKAKPHILQLTATLRNRASIDVGYPALDLVLTDNREHALARRVFVPVDYLPGADAAKSVIAANAEITVRVDMNVGDLPAAGFRLNLMPAPGN